MKNAFSIIVAMLLAAFPLAASAQTSTPVAVVKSAYSCVFSKTCSESKARTYLTASFAKKFATIDSLEKTCQCEVIDASPWVDAQAGPATFSLGTASIKGNAATVPIHFHGGKSGAYSMTVKTEHTASGWAISDILTRNGKSTAAMMATNIASTQKWLASPGAVLRQFQTWHFRATANGSLLRSFDAGKVFLAPTFAAEVKTKLSQPVDPFTLSMARVTDWEFGKATVTGDTATALARLQFKGGTHAQIVYHLTHSGGKWVISGISRP